MVERFVADIGRVEAGVRRRRRRCFLATPAHGVQSALARSRQGLTLPFHETKEKSVIKNDGGLASSVVRGSPLFWRYAGSTATISYVSGSMIRISLRTMM